MYTEVKNSYMTLSMIDLHFKIGDKYKTTDELEKEIRIMIMNRMKMCMNGGDPAEYPAIQNFFSYFDKEFQGLRDKSLIKGVETPIVKQQQKSQETSKQKPQGAPKKPIVDGKKDGLRNREDESGGHG